MVATAASAGKGEIAAAHGEAVKGKKKARLDAGTEFRGVRRRGNGMYTAKIWNPSRRSQVWLGTFATAEDATKAYDAAAFGLHAAGVVVKKKAEYRGVRLLTGKYEARIWDPSRRAQVHLGRFGTAKEAARAYDAAAARLHGAKAKPNFMSEAAEEQEGAVEGVERMKMKACPDEAGKGNARRWLGSFDTADEAARAYDAEAVTLLGERAITNFKRPDMDLNGFAELPALDFFSRTGSIIPGPQLDDDLWTDLPDAELQPVDELLQDMDFTVTGVAA